jgi:hypothetical protein
VVANSPALLLKPAFRKTLKPSLSWIIFKYGPVISRLGWFGRQIIEHSSFFKAMKLKIESFRPDVLLVLDINLFPAKLLKKLVSPTVLCVGEIASPLPPKKFVHAYDMIFSAHPGLVREITNLGVKAVWQPLGIDAEAFEALSVGERDIDAVFVGSFGRLQKNTGPLLAEIKKSTPTLEIFGNAKNSELRKFGLLENYRGPAWGSKMHSILRRAKISINRHGEIAGPYAANMRMYESTAAGALLMTEEKSNLTDLFIPGEEVVTYSSNADAAQKVRFYLDNPQLLEKIASAGSVRTLRNHTYRQRVISMLDEIGKLARGKRK